MCRLYFLFNERVEKVEVQGGVHCRSPYILAVVDTTAVSRSPLSGVADNNKFFCGWQKMGIY